MTGRAKIWKKWEYWLEDGSRAIMEVLKVDDKRYEDGMRFSYRLLSADGETLFAIENEHGKPHIHRKNRKDDLDCDWETGMRKFKEMVRGHAIKLETMHGR